MNTNDPVTTDMKLLDKDNKPFTKPDEEEWECTNEHIVYFNKEQSKWFRAMLEKTDDKK